MPQGAILVKQDGTIILSQDSSDDTEAVEAALLEMAERSEGQGSYRLTAASIWRARRSGHALHDIVRTLETHSATALPPKLRAEITRWSKQIDRLTLVVDRGRLLLRSHSPLAITAVQQHSQLKALIARPVNATTLELHAERYPELIQTFDACRYPVLDQTPPGWRADTVPAAPGIRRVTPTVLPEREETSQEQRWESTVGLLLRLPRQCQAVTRAGRQCKNRTQPASRYCRVHTDWASAEEPPEAFTSEEPLVNAMLAGMLEAGLVTLSQLAVARISVLMGLGFAAWLAVVLLRALGVSTVLGLPSWVVAILAGVVTCGLVGRMLAGLRLRASLYVVWVIFAAMLLDCLHKEGLILNICYVAIPAVGPAMLLAYADYALAWTFLWFPVGLLVGRLFYGVLEATSTP